MCTEQDLRRVLLDTKSGLEDIFGASLRNVILYGSYARGEQDAESDIDVMALVDLPKDELARYRRRVSDFSSGIDLKYNVLLSIKLQDAETFHRYSDSLPFFRNVMREGIHIEKNNIRLCDTLEYAKNGTMEEEMRKLFNQALTE